ncbi:ATP-dependent RNA helicase HrpA [Alteromonas sp. SM 2104]|nr:ATP-dependent RNA helicase HrpA [Alteromonas oceanisediminis]
MKRDEFRFSRQIKRFNEKAISSSNDKWLALCEHIAASQAHVSRRHSAIPAITYPDLPVSSEKATIQQTIQENQVVIIAGETGSGKTTQIPKMLLELGFGCRGLIAHTQPRRLAARSVANRIADELDTTLGDTVGFKIRFSDSVSDTTYIKLMTDGILLAEMQNDRFLNQYDTIIIDEAHERSLNIDFILGYLKQLLPKRPDLRVIVTSATIDPQRFSEHFDGAPIIEVSGRTFPVEIRYRDSGSSDDDQTQQIIDAVDELSREKPGDILVFLSGERDIRDTQYALERQQYRHTEIVPLYARLSASEQNRIFQSHSGRRIVLATNVAETSLTVPGIKYVIDPGTARISRYSARSKVQRLPIEAISQASANQRAGRCGRTSDGVCIRLYSEEDYLGRPEFTDPEILRTNLASVILQMLGLGLGSIEAFPFVQAPDGRNIRDGFLLLEELQAVSQDKRGPVLTDVGKRLTRLPIDPRYARMIVTAGEFDAVTEVAVIAAGLSIQDPRERPQEFRQKADEAHKMFEDPVSDFIGLLNLWNTFKQQQRALSNSQLRKWCKTHFVHYLRMREWQDIVSQIKHSLVSCGLRLNSQPADPDNVHKAIASGLLSQIGQLDSDRQYLGARNTHFMIFPGSGLAKKTPKWVMAAELVETSRLFARLVAKIDPSWLEPLARHLTKSSYSEPRWSKKRGAVMADEKVLLYGLPIVPKRAINYASIDPVTCHTLFVREALVNGVTQLNYAFLQRNQELLAEIDELEQKTRRRDLLVSEDELADFYFARIPDHIVSEASFKKWIKTQSKSQIDELIFSRDDVTKVDVAADAAILFPEYWRQDNVTLPLTYHFEPSAEDDGVSVMVPLPLLNQINDIGFEWQVPGLRAELIVALIKSLPKRLRRHFVPAPDFANACLVSFKDDQVSTSVPLTQALSAKLHKMTGVAVEDSEWQWQDVPRHLRMTFKVVDTRGKVISSGKQLLALQNALQGRVQDTLNQAATPEFERSGLTEWDFEQLPDKFVQRTGQFEVKAFPALKAQKNAVDIRLFDSPQEADAAHAEGVRTLVLLAIPSPIKYLQNALPNKAKLGLYFNPFGSIQSLIEDCVKAAIDHFCHAQFDGYTHVRSKAQFSQLCEFARANINDEVFQIALSAEKGLVIAAAIQKALKGKIDIRSINAMADIKSHLQRLVYPGFVSDIGAGRLNDWQRYLSALQKRLEKVHIDPNRDRLHALAIEKVTTLFQQKCDAYRLHAEIPPALLETRWMIEEFRVSLFAQQLGTQYPISAKRIENHLANF